MKAIDRPFINIINGTTQFVIPVFQRDYTWHTEPQCAQLWRDVLRAAREHGHFLGSVVYIATDDCLAGFTRWLLIDGQQRLTTLTLLLVGLRDHIRETGWTGGGEDDPTPRKIDAYFLKNVMEEGDREQKLVLRRHDQATLRALLDGEGTASRRSASGRALIISVSSYRKQIRQALAGRIRTEPVPQSLEADRAFR